jgi:hypothetical protein
MSWTKREGPLVSVPKRHGFGTIVMETMAESSLEGKVDLHYAQGDRVKEFVTRG